MPNKYKYFSTFDLKSAYHQIPIKEEDRPFTAFEANGKLYQYKRIPFGVTNGVAAFQRIVDKIVEQEKLTQTFPYLDNITIIAGHTKEEHDCNVEKFLAAVKRRKLTLNENKSVLSVQCINILGYQVSRGSIKPDPDRLKPLQEMACPTTKFGLQRVLGMFAYYSKWIPNYSDIAQPLYKSDKFPLEEAAIDSFNKLKELLTIATLAHIDESQPFVVECDASDISLSATLNQGGRPVAFMSRTFTGSEKYYAPVENEATAIIEAVHKWAFTF